MSPNSGELGRLAGETRDGWIRPDGVRRYVKGRGGGFGCTAGLEGGCKELLGFVFARSFCWEGVVSDRRKGERSEDDF